MNETFINLLQQNRTKKVGGEEEELTYHQVKMPMRKFLKRRSSQVHRGNARIWTNHRMMRTAMKKVMALTVEFARSLGQNVLTEKCRDWSQCDMCDEYICSKCYGKRDDDFL